MAESESDALPLGDTPIFTCFIQLIYNITFLSACQYLFSNFLKKLFIYTIIIYTCVVVIVVFMSITEGNPFEKGFPSGSLPKTFSLNLRPIGCYPMGLEFILKVFGRGFGRKPFFRKVSPDKYRYKNSINIFFRQDFLQFHQLQPCRRVREEALS